MRPHTPEACKHESTDSKAETCLDATPEPGLRLGRIGSHALIVQPGAGHDVLVEPAATTDRVSVRTVLGMLHLGVRPLP